MSIRLKRYEGRGIDLRLINAIKGKMIRKWIVLNIFISVVIIIIVGYSIKEFACYQFNQFSHAPGQSEQFRNTIETYLLFASIFAFVFAVAIHLFFARKILQPLRNLTRSHDQNIRLRAVTSNDEVGQIAKDILHISKRVHELQKQNEQLLADIAHELRTPLTTLNGYLKGLEDGIFSFDEATTAILKKECERLITFIERMNELHEWEQTEIINSEVNIKDLLEVIVIEYRRTFEEAGIHIQIDMEPVRLFSNAKALRAVMRELLDNVVHYHVGKEVWIKGFRESDQYFISISNEGKLISDEDAKHIFDRFYRVEPSRNRNSGGAGLGLSIAKQIVLRLSGDIGYDSNNRVHTFWFSLPLPVVRNHARS